MDRFLREMLNFVHGHAAINNPYLARLQRGAIDETEFYRFACEFWAFAKNFVGVLAIGYAKCPDWTLKTDMGRILVEELGGEPTADGKLLVNIEENQHLDTYHNFLTSIGLDPSRMYDMPFLPGTRAFVDAQYRLYGADDYLLAQGASFGLENMALRMWRQTNPGLKRVRERMRDRLNVNLGYFTYHAQIETHHEAHTEDALANLPGRDDPDVQARFRRGAAEVLAAEAAFWNNLEAERGRPYDWERYRLETPRFFYRPRQTTVDRAARGADAGAADSETPPPSEGGDHVDISVY
jgi:pyrroloquinoline quinone (PQQ) biosynthesis protein C